MMISTDPNIWVAAILTLFIYSYYVKPEQNIAFRFAQSTVVGVSMGYIITVVMAKNIDAMVISNLAAGKIIYIVPTLLGLMTYSGLSPKYRYLTRIPISFIVSIGLAIGARAAIESQIFNQIKVYYNLPILGVDPFTSFNNLILLIGLIATIFYFIFTFHGKTEKGSSFNYLSAIGRYILMIYFGAKFATIVLARATYFTGRMQFLLYEWLGFG